MYSNSSLEEIEDFGIISLMYHRFEENKYPSTNIKINDFKEHLKILEEDNIKFINPKNFENELKVIFEKNLSRMYKINNKVKRN